MNRRGTLIAAVIEVAVGLTLLPRWIPALMLAEGIPLPVSWRPWWVPLSATFNAGMAITEAAAIAYVFYAWHHSNGKEAKRLLILAGAMVFTFSVVLAPFIASSITQVAIQLILAQASSFVPALLWGTAVVLSTGVTVMAVGVAQGSEGIRGKQENVTEIPCWCGEIFSSQHELDQHAQMHVEEVAKYETPQEALAALDKTYGSTRNLRLPPMPELVEIVKMKKVWRTDE